MWHWLLHSPGGIATRVTIGLCILIVFATVDIRRKGREATRWREYVFLVCTVAIAMAYGIVNDQITSRISWEYYAYGKGLWSRLGDHLPPDPARLSWEAAKVGMGATWTAGLIIGVCCLFANNPRKDRPRLSYPTLLARVPWIMGITAITAAILGLIGFKGGLVPFNDDFREMVQADQFRPFRFMAVYGIHCGGYIGGALGTVAVMLSISLSRRAKNRLAIGLDS